MLIPMILGVKTHRLEYIKNICMGEDGRPSTSKLQFFLWTVVVLFSYASIKTIYLLRENWTAFDIDRNTLIALGLSVGTTIIAKGIAVNRQGTADASPGIMYAVADITRIPKSSYSFVFTDDLGRIDIGKIQLLAWTFIAIAIYLYETLYKIYGYSSVEQLPSTRILPVIDDSLLVLTGLADGAYLGKKLVTTTTPRLTGISLASSKRPYVVTITGAAFGTTHEGSFIVINDNANSNITTESWTDSQIKFHLPDKQPNGADWPAGAQIKIGLIVGGRDSANTLTLTLPAPKIDNIDPKTGKPPIALTITGETFGKPRGDSAVTINGKPYPGPKVEWEENSIKFPFPEKQSDASAWSPGQVSIGVIVAGKPSTTTAYFTVQT
jgi:hypothetical protein